MKMTKNIHSIERVVRGVAGAGLIAIVFVGPQTPWGWLGLIPLGTALSGWCLPYSLLGISTCAVKDKAES